MNKLEKEIEKELDSIRDRIFYRNEHNEITDEELEQGIALINRLRRLVI